MRNIWLHKKNIHLKENLKTKTKTPTPKKQKRDELSYQKVRQLFWYNRYGMLT